MGEGGCFETLRNSTEPVLPPSVKLAIIAAVNRTDRPIDKVAVGGARTILIVVIGHVRNPRDSRGRNAGDKTRRHVRVPRSHGYDD